MYQHKNDLRNDNRNSPLVEHRDKFSHPIDPNLSKLFLPMSNLQNRKLFESYIIVNSENLCRNDGMLSNDTSLVNFLGQFKPFQAAIEKSKDPP